MVQRRVLPTFVVLTMIGWLVLRAGIAPAFADPRVYSDVQQRGGHLVVIRAGANDWGGGRKVFCVFIYRNGTLVDSPSGDCQPFWDSGITYHRELNCDNGDHFGVTVDVWKDGDGSDEAYDETVCVCPCQQAGSAKVLRPKEVQDVLRSRVGDG